MNKQEFKEHLYGTILKLNNETVEEAEKKKHVNVEEAEQIWECLEHGHAYIEMPAWLAEQKCGITDAHPPTEFIAKITRETDKAVFVESATAIKTLRSNSLVIYIDQLLGANELHNVWLPKSQIKIYRK